MKRNEMEILRALSIKLDDDTVFILTYQYHTEKSEADPEGRKNDKTKSRYRMIGRIERIADVEKAITALHSDSERTKSWKWPADPSWSGDILYMKDASNEGQSNWLRLKLRKAISREEGAFLLRGYKKDVKLAAELKRKNRKAKPEDIYTIFTPNAVYDTVGYTCSDGSVVDISDFDSLTSKVGQNVWKEIKMKFVGSSPANNSPSVPSISGSNLEIVSSS